MELVITLSRMHFDYYLNLSSSILLYKTPLALVRKVNYIRMDYYYYVCFTPGRNTPMIIPQDERLVYCSRLAPQGLHSSDFGKLLFAEVTCILGICLVLDP